MKQYYIKVTTNINHKYFETVPDSDLDHVKIMFKILKGRLPGGLFIDLMLIKADGKHKALLKDMTENIF